MERVGILIKTFWWLLLVFTSILLNEILAPRYPDFILLRSISLIILFLIVGAYLFISKREKAFAVFTFLAGFYLLGGSEVKTDTVFGALLMLVGLISIIRIGRMTSDSKAAPGEHEQEEVRPKKRFLRSVATLLFLPFFLLNDVLKPRDFLKRLRSHGLKTLVTKKSFTLRNIFSKIFATIIAFFILFTLVPMWVAGYVAVLYVPAMALWVAPFPFETPVTGHSMEPTLKDGSQENFYIYNGLLSLFKKPGKGDLITFSSGTTVDENNNVTTFVKRVVATQGDEVEIRDGFLQVNGHFVEESYIRKPRSTFGGTFLQECKKVKVPDGFVFTLGDNRARSQDSRTVGFVSIKDITSIIPFSRQDRFMEGSRDASHDKERAGLMSFGAETYYELFNKKREENGLKPLKRNLKLENAATKRARWIIDNNELGVKPEESGYTPQKAQGESGYSNVVSGEMFTSGYFDSEDLANYWMEYDTKIQVLEKNYQDTGIGAVVGKVNGCEMQVIVQEFGGYIPPNYSSDMISNWEKSLNQLKSVLPSWENIRNYPQTYSSNKQDADRLLEIMRLRITRMEIIVSKMKSGQWLSAEENNWTYEDEQLYNEQESITKRLNSQVWK